MPLSKQRKNEILKTASTLGEKIMFSRKDEMLDHDAVEEIITRPNQPTNVGKHAKLVKKIIDDPSQAKASDIAKLVSLCSIEDYMRSMYEIGTADALYAVAEITKVDKVLYQSLLGIGEMAMHLKNGEELVKDNFVKKLMTLYNSRKDMRTDAVVMMVLKCLTELLYAPYGCEDEIHFGAIDLFFEYAVDREFTIAMPIHVAGVGTNEMNMPQHIAGQSLRGLLVLQKYNTQVGFMNDRLLELNEKARALTKSKNKIVVAYAKELLGIEKAPSISTEKYTQLYSRDSVVQKCFTCQKAADKDTVMKRCSKCRKAYYCSVACQKKDWNKHKLECKP
jgi:hypothetical protein